MLMLLAEGCWLAHRLVAKRLLAELRWIQGLLRHRLLVHGLREVTERLIRRLLDMARGRDSLSRAGQSRRDLRRRRTCCILDARDTRDLGRGRCVEVMRVLALGRWLRRVCLGLEWRSVLR